MLHINNSNRMFCSIHDFTFHMTDKKKKGQGSFEFSGKKKLLPTWFLVQFVMLPAQSIVLANWFACVPACTSAIVQVSMASLCHTLCPRNHTYVIVYISSSFVVHKFKMMISPGFFFKIFLVGRRSKGKKCPKLTKNSVCCCALCLRNHTSEGLIQRFF